MQEFLGLDVAMAQAHVQFGVSGDGQNLRKVQLELRPYFVRRGE